MDDLIAFLRARLDEDEAIARNAAVLPYGATEWFAGAEGSVFAVEPSQLHVRGAILSLDDIGTHIARWDPARVLAEVQAKRRILDLADDGGDGGHPDGYWAAKVDVIAILALTHAEHPDYREEWRPDV